MLTWFEPNFEPIVFVFSYSMGWGRIRKGKPSGLREVNLNNTKKEETKVTTK